MKIKLALIALLLVAALLVSGCCCCVVPSHRHYRVPYRICDMGHVVVKVMPAAVPAMFARPAAEK